MTIASNFPAIKPSLLLDFANTKRLDPRVTFTRATTATYYDGVTTAKAEENLFLQSQTFDVSGWTLARASITANTSVAPDGTTTAETLTADGTAGTHLIQSDDSLTPAGQTRTMSVFAKAGTNNFIQLAFGVDAAPYANFDLSGGTVGNSASVTASIVSVGSGWYRCIVTTTSSTASGARFFIITNGTSVRGESNSLNTTVLIWGAQMEYRSSVTAYTATTTQPITNYIPVLLTAASGVPRFDHNPTTDESLGLLVEEQRTNLFTYSADFSNAAWTKGDSVVISNTIVAPNGTLTGQAIYDNINVSNTAHQVTQGVSVTSGTSYTISAYIKAGNGIGFSMGAAATGAFSAEQRVIFDASTGVATLSLGTPTNITMTSVGNGWYRCACTVTPTSTATMTVVIRLYNSSASGFYIGDGTQYAFLWGAQLEAGAFPTSYIATTSATVTRNADAASMTGTNFSSWFNNAEGTLYTDYQLPFLSSATTQGPAQIDDGSANNRFTLRTSQASNNNAGVVVTSGTTQVALTSTLATVNATQKISLAYKVNDFAYCDKAGTVGTDTAGTVPVTNRMLIGLVGTVDYLNGTIKKIAYYPLRVTNAQLQALTS